MTKLVRRSIVVMAAVLAATLIPVEASAAPPPPGYKSWEINTVVHNNTIGEDIPIRHGYYDADADRGFGEDKMYFKHDVTNMSMVRHIIQQGDVSFGGVDGQYSGQAQIRRTLRVTYCLPVQGGVIVCQPGDPHRMLVVVELDEHDFYYDGRASMMPDPDYPPIQDPVKPYIMNGGNYIPDEKIVGVVTCFEEGEDGPIHPELKEWDYMKEVFPYEA